jgi:excisionase family DNA binding protein
MKELKEIAAATRTLEAQLNEARRQFGAELCVRLPFHASYRPAFEEPATKVQAAMIRWREALAERNAALREWLTWNEQPRSEDLFPLLGFGRTPNFGTSWSVEACAGFLRQEVAALERLAKPGAEPELLSADDMARRLGLTKSRVYELARRKQLPSVRLGRLVRFPAGRVEEFLQNGRSKR